MTTLENTPKQNVPVAKSFGSGRYSKHMESTFNDLKQVFGLSDKVAKRIADDFGSELGAHMKRAEVDVSLGKINAKNNTISIKEASKLKGIVVTNTILAVRACTWVAEAFQNGIDFQETQWKPKQVLQEYFDTLEKELPELE